MRCPCLLLFGGLILFGAPCIAADGEPEQALPKEALERISGDQGRIGQRGMTKEFVFTTILKNENPDWTVTGLTIAIVPQGAGSTGFPNRDYDVSVILPPLANKRIQVDIEAIGKSDFSWQVKAAKGTRSD